MQSGKFLTFALVLALVGAACQRGGSEGTDASTTAATTSGAAGSITTGESESPGLDQGLEPYTYRLGIFEDTTTDNFWAAQDTLSTVWNSYVLTPTKPALYAINYPGLEVVPDLAASPEIPGRCTGCQVDREPNP